MKSYPHALLSIWLTNGLNFICDKVCEKVEFWYEQKLKQDLSLNAFWYCF